jgi:hypothetical protein
MGPQQCFDGSAECRVAGTGLLQIRGALLREAPG